MIKLHSFDLFDTLVTRAVKRPVDVFLLLGADRACTFRFAPFRWIPFHRWRHWAQRLARRLTRRDEIRLIDIYRILGVVLQHPARVMRKELALELALSLPIPERIEEANRCVASGERCCLISDMYLPIGCIRKLIRKNGIAIEKLYLSSAIGLTKRSGKLYEAVRAQEGLEFSEMAHVGDHPLADVAIPRRLGITVDPVAVPPNARSANFLSCFKLPECDLQHAEAFRIGFQIAGPLALAYAAFIARRAPPERFSSIVFGARDGYLPIAAYRRFFARPTQEVHYCRISRQLVYLADMSASQCLDDRLFFEGIDDADALFKRLGVACPEALRGLPVREHRADIEAWLNESGFLQTLANEEQSVRNYLRASGFIGDRVAFVDIGWRGTIQDALASILKNEVDLQGFYLGLSLPASNKTAFLFEGLKNFKTRFAMFQGVFVSEFIFREPCSSVVSVRQDGAGFVLDFGDKEPEYELAIRKTIQAGAFRFFDAYAPLSRVLDFDERGLGQAIRDVLYQNLLYPTAEMIAALPIEDAHAEVCKGKSGFAEYAHAPWKAQFLLRLKKERPFQAWLYATLIHNRVFFFGFEAARMLFSRRFRSYRRYLKRRARANQISTILSQ